jgi:3-deoxy-manno-octulosonate cytidylyltransferase (CMP-KDO synthetase)
MAQTAIVVPCRLESTRFPQKLLHSIKGRPLVLWVAARLAQEVPELPLWFAVDHERLRDCLAGAGFRVLMTSAAHQSGTDRIAEANRTIRADFVVNVQADEPLVTGGQIRALDAMLRAGAPMATLATPFRRAVDFTNPNQVKVVLGARGETDSPTAGRTALFFSRAPIPFARERAGIVDDAWVAAHPCYKHLGLYGYAASLLEKFAKLPAGRLEQIEKLEQLRVLENGYEIACEITEDPTIGVDTPDDAAVFERHLQAQS